MKINWCTEKKISQEKKKLKSLRSKVEKLTFYGQDEVLTQINTLIGRLNCYLTDDNETLNKLCKKDKI